MLYILLYISTDVFVDPPVQVGRTDNEFYSVDFDDTSVADGTGLDDRSDDDSPDDGPTMIACTSIVVVPPAKRYHNSVCLCMHMLHQI